MSCKRIVRGRCHRLALVAFLGSVALSAMHARAGGVTIITHGFTPTSCNVDDTHVWLDAMADAVKDRTQDPNAASIWTAWVTGDPPQVSDVILEQGPNPFENPTSNGEIIIKLNWREHSSTDPNNCGACFAAFTCRCGGIPPITCLCCGPTPTHLIAQAVADWMTGGFARWVEQPIHLVGHSRGASVMSATARMLGQRGVWVDHVTYLDPHPVNGDWPNDDCPPFNPDWGDEDVSVFSNVVFADNYWRSDPAPSPNGCDFDGEAISGCLNVQLNESQLDGDGYFFEHQDTHLWYHGSIDTTSTAFDGDESVPQAWYAYSDDSRGPREGVGYNWGRVARGRPWDTPASNGYSSILPNSQGFGARLPVNLSSALWANLPVVRILDDLEYEVGDMLSVRWYHHDHDSTATVRFYLDADSNPYNGKGSQLGPPIGVSVTPGISPAEHVSDLSTAGVTPSPVKWLLAEITDGERTRYTYAWEPIDLRPAGAPVTYTIFASAGSHGSISPSGGVEVEEGGSQTFFATPNGGYQVDRWYLDGVEQPGGGTSFPISNVQRPHALYVTFKTASAGGTITVTSPSGGETFCRGDNLTINWEAPPLTCGNVRIELYRGGSFNRTIRDSTANSGGYSWEIPDNQALGTDYSVCVSCLSSGASDCSGVFEIDNCTPPSGPILITNAFQLQAMCSDSQHPPDGHYVLANDIDASVIDNFEPIGDGSSNYFRGVFDGQGHTIEGLYIDRGDEVEVGLFSVLWDTAIVKNIAFDGNCSVRGKTWVGALAGRGGGRIINCHSAAEVLGESSIGNKIGGLCGELYDGVIINCSAMSNTNWVRGDGDDVGGLVGLTSHNATIIWCRSAPPQVESYGSRVGAVTGSNAGHVIQSFGACPVQGNVQFVGGIVGFNSDTTVDGSFALVSDSYSLGTVWGRYNSTGGVVGYNFSQILRCFAVGGITPVGQAGGLVGWHNTSIGHSVWDVTTTGIPEARPVGLGDGSVVDCFGLQTATMKQAQTYLNLGWDFEKVWWIDEGVTYPQLCGVGPVLPIPTGMSASQGLGEGVVLNWNAVSYEGDCGPFYRIYRAASPSGARTPVSDWIAGEQFVDATAAPLTTYYYWVKAAATTYESESFGTLAARESDFSSMASGWRAEPPAGTPTNVQATDGLAYSILIEWEPVGNASHYRVFRSQTVDGPKTPLGGWQTQTAYNDVPPQAEANYLYWVKAAMDANGLRESGYGGPDAGSFFVPDLVAPTVAVQATPVQPIETQEVELAVTVTDNGTLQLVVLRWNDGADHEVIADGGGSGQAQWSEPIGSFAAGVVIEYWAEAWDAAGNHTATDPQDISVFVESVSTPNRPSGPTALEPGDAGTYSTSGAVSNLGSAVQYQFEWGDGTQSTWAGASRSKSWAAEGNYLVRARARSQTNTNRMSNWSTTLTVRVETDECPNDPNKTEPGLCGCGVADTDTDMDGTPNCNESCDNDPNKLSPGVCGCGVVEDVGDADGDGTVNCTDPCPLNANDNCTQPPPPVCGNTVCEEGETCESCAVDCGPCPPVCGDGECNGDESCKTCEADCPPTGPRPWCGGGPTCGLMHMLPLTLGCLIAAKVRRRRRAT